MSKFTVAVKPFIKGKQFDGFTVMASRFPGRCKCGCQANTIGRNQQIAYGKIDGESVTVLWPQCPEARSAKGERTPDEIIASPSDYQQDIGKAVTAHNRHIIVKALAGTGKTTTALWVLALLLQFAKRTAREIGRVMFLAFNTSVADHLAPQMPFGTSARTTHSYGKSAIDRAFPKAKFVKREKTPALLNKYIPEGDDKHPHYHLRRAIIQLVTNAKNAALLPAQKDAINALVDSEAAPIDLDDEGDRQAAVDIASKVLADGMPQRGKLESYDFEDMLYIPAVLNIPVDACGFVVVDEAQDFCPSQIKLTEKLIKAGARVMMVGDEFQSLYAFRGADTKAFQRLADLLAADGRGADTFLLPVNYRCGKAIIRKAQTIVPEIQAAPNAPEGEVNEALPFSDMLATIRPGDAILCRVNAPLVDMALKLIRSFKPVRILGKDEIGTRLEGLIDLVCSTGTGRNRTINNPGIPALLEALSKYEDDQAAKLSNNPKAKWRLDTIKSNCECIRMFCTATTVTDAKSVKELIGSLFVGDNAPKTAAITLSSIHKSKGLEWDRVFILCPDKMPHPLAAGAEQEQQERNCMYVAWTRAKFYLGIVEGFSKSTAEESLAMSA